MKEYTVYYHSKADTLEPFYVGMGKDGRHKSKHSRNSSWHEVVKKHGFVVGVIANWNTEQEALEHEKLIISSFKDIGYKLVNRTNGGKGILGRVRPLEERLQISEKLKGRVAYQMTPQIQEKISKTLKGKLTGVNGTRHDSTVFKWNHPEYGNMECTKLALREKYNISSSHIAKVVSGKVKFAKGWVCLGKA